MNNPSISLNYSTEPLSCNHSRILCSANKNLPGRQNERARSLAGPSCRFIRFSKALTPYGRVPAVWFFAASDSGITAGTATPTTTCTWSAPLEELTRHTFPAMSTVRPLGPPR